MPVQYKFGGKAKLTKGQTYPIKRSEFDAALNEAGVTELEYVGYSCHFGPRKEKSNLIDVFMMGEARIPGEIHRRAPTVFIGSVHKNDSPWIKEQLAEKKILKNLASWLKRLEDAESVRRDMNQHFKVFYTKEELIVERTE